MKIINCFFQKRILVLSAVFLFSISCNKDDTEDRVESDQTIVNKAQAVEVFSGRNRAKLNLILLDPVNGWARIFWNNKKDSIQAEVKEYAGKDTISVFIESLNEGIYDFVIYLSDIDGNKSEGVKISGTVYGDSYEASLSNRSIRTVDVNDETIIINWEKANMDILGTELYYSDLSEINQFLTILPNEEITEIADYFFGSEVKYRSFYLPKENAIDTFYTAFQSIIPVEPKLVWDGDAAKGASVFKGLEPDEGASITVVEDPVYGKVWKFNRPEGVNRCEAKGAKGYDSKEGDLIYIGMRYKLEMPKDITVTGIFQWKTYGSPNTINFPVLIRPVNGNLLLHPHNPKAEIWSIPTPTYQWFTMVLAIKESYDSSVGYIEFWYNGVKQTFTNGSTRYYCQTLDGEYCEPKWGVYGMTSSAKPQSASFVQGLKIATTYELAAP